MIDRTLIIVIITMGLTFFLTAVKHNTQTPLHYAANSGSEYICRFLVSAGAAVNIVRPPCPT